MTGTTLRERRAAKYVDGGFEQCKLCMSEPDEIHHTSYFPEEAVAVCSSCHSHIHAGDFPGLQPDSKRPEDYEKVRRRQERVEKYTSRRWQVRRRMELDSERVQDTGSPTSGGAL